MATLADLARLIRSKNAGPFTLTIDIMFEGEEGFRRVVDAGVITAERVGALYGAPPERVRVFVVPDALAIKVSLPRPVPSGDLDDADIFGGQQYAPLVDLEVPG